MPKEELNLFPNYFVLITVMYIAAFVWTFTAFPFPDVLEILWFLTPLFVPIPFLVGYFAYYIRYREKPALMVESSTVKIIKWAYIGLACLAVAWGLILSVPMSL